NGQLPPPLRHRNGGRSAHALAGGDILGGVRCAGDLRPHADRYVPHHARLAAHHHIVLEHRRAGNADMAGQHAVPSDHDVVPDLNEIINFRPLTDDRVLERAAVDAAVGADLHVVLDDHPADLGDLEV